MVIAYIPVCGVTYRVVVEPRARDTWGPDYVTIRWPFRDFGPLYHTQSEYRTTAASWYDVVGGVVFDDEIVAWVCPD